MIYIYFFYKNRAVRLFKKRRIAEREESVLLLDRLFVDFKRFFSARKRRYKHNQRAFGQMEVGDKPLDALKLVAGIDKDARVALLRANISVIVGNRFKRTHA